MEVQFIRKIAQGAFGFIDLVEGSNAFKLARKTLRPQRRRDEIHNLVKKRFRNEIAFMQKIQHPLLTPIIDAETEGDQPFFLMPLANASLKQDLKNLAQDRKWAKQALFDILDSLEFLHSQGFYHRDICCANILRFETLQGARYKLTDFGSVTPLGSKGPFHKIDSGHYRYAPPEIARQPGLGSAQSDIFGFGAILHEIFGENPRPAKKCISTENGPLGAIMNKCTRENPENRYQDILTLYKDLEQAFIPDTKSVPAE